MSTLKHLQADIASHMRSGATFTTVEDDVISLSALSDSERSALRRLDHLVAGAEARELAGGAFAR
jgi:hypothetical protein